MGSSQDTSTGLSGRLLAVTDAQLAQISPYPIPQGTAEEINDVVADAKIASHLELAHFVAQCCYESAYFRGYVEPPVAGRYEFNLKLGNNAPGDGQKFRGRGAIQLTGRANYSGFNNWLRAKEESREIDMFTAPFDVTDTPDAVGSAPYRWLAAAYYWASRPRLRQLAQEDDCAGVTRIITGASTPAEAQGFQMRLTLTERAIEALG